MSKPTTEEELKTIIEMAAAGSTVREIAATVGKSIAVISKLTRREKAKTAAPRTADSLKQEIIKNLDPKALSTSQKIATLRTLSKNRGKKTPESVAEEIDRLRAAMGPPVDLSIYESKPCTSCGVEWACDAAPVCAKCLPDTPAEKQEWREVGPFMRIRPPAPCSVCGVNAETGDDDHLCNACRRAIPPKEVCDVEH